MTRATEPRGLPPSVDGRPIWVDIGSGIGGWIDGAKIAGFYTVGVDIKDLSTKNAADEFWIADVRSLNGRSLRDVHVISGSMPCQRFSQFNSKTRDPAEGMKLVREFMRVVSEARAGSEGPLWVMENVKASVPHISREFGPPRLRANPWYFWGDFPPFLREQSNPHYKGRIGKPLVFTLRKGPEAGKTKVSYRTKWPGAEKASKIPLGIARPLAEACREGWADWRSLPRETLAATRTAESK